MALSVIHPPGTPLGPCITDHSVCTHRDCAEMYTMADTRCTICSRPIGFRTRFYETTDRSRPKPERTLVHADCVEEESE